VHKGQMGRYWRDACLEWRWGRSFALSPFGVGRAFQILQPWLRKKLFPELNYDQVGLLPSTVAVA